MSILVYTESEKNEFKKSALEALSYAKALGEKMNETVTCVSINCTDYNQLKKHGADKIIDIQNPSLEKFISKSYAEAINQIAESENIKIIILSSSTNSKYLGAYLSGKLESAYISNVVELPSQITPFLIKRTCYTNKAFSTTEIKSEIKIISVSTNSFGIIENTTDPDIDNINVQPNEEDAYIEKFIDYQILRQSGFNLTTNEASLALLGKDLEYSPNVNGDYKWVDHNISFKRIRNQKTVVGLYGDVRKSDLELIKNALQVLHVVAPGLDISYSSETKHVTLPIHITDCENERGRHIGCNRFRQGRSWNGQSLS